MFDNLIVLMRIRPSNSKLDPLELFAASQTLFNGFKPVMASVTQTALNYSEIPEFHSHFIVEDVNLLLVGDPELMEGFLHLWSAIVHVRIRNTEYCMFGQNVSLMSNLREISERSLTP